MPPLDNLIQPIWDVTPYSITLISFDGDPTRRKIAYVNPAFTELTGYSSAEAVGSPVTLLNGPRTSQAAVEEYESAVAQGKPCKTALVHYRKDGSEYAALATIAPLVEPECRAEYLILIETVIANSNPSPTIDESINSGITVPLHLPMPLKEFTDGSLPTHLVSHPALDGLQTLWVSLRGDRPLPLRSDFDLDIVTRWASHLSIVTVMPTGRFQFRLFGTELARVYGQDLTGFFLDELTPRDLWSVIILHYQEVVRTRQPLFAPISVANGRWYSEVSRLLLPLAAKVGDTVAFVMGADYTRF
jgi:PAS domain S-box-containing protein